MKSIKWKILVITCLLCIVPIIPGMFLWDSLPDSMAIHFNLNNEPDNFVSKGFAVYGLPCIMLLVQIVCCVLSDCVTHKQGGSKKFEETTKWILPVILIVVQTMVLVYNLGREVDVRKVATIMVSVVFWVVGSGISKLDYVKNYKIDVPKAKKINRFAGIGMVIMGVLAFFTVFMPPTAFWVWLLLMIPYTVCGVVYSIKICREKEC